MELRDIYELWDRFDHSTVDEIELHMQGDSFHLRKGSSGLSGSSMTSGYTDSSFASAPANKNGSFYAGRESAFSDGLTKGQIEESSLADKETSAKSALSEEKSYTVEIKAPLVGTFYRASSPDAEPFITIGQEVHKGDVIGIIEAMKLMNELVAHEDGKVVEILVQDGQMVEYDQVLVRMA